MGEIGFSQGIITEPQEKLSDLGELIGTQYDQNINQAKVWTIPITPFSMSSRGTEHAQSSLSLFEMGGCCRPCQYLPLFAQCPILVPAMLA